MQSSKPMAPDETVKMVELLGLADALLTDAHRLLDEQCALADKREAALSDAEKEIAELTLKVRRLMIQCLDTRTERDALAYGVELIRDLVTCDEMEIEESTFRIFEISSAILGLDS